MIFHKIKKQGCTYLFEFNDKHEKEYLPYNNKFYCNIFETRENINCVTREEWMNSYNKLIKWYEKNKEYPKLNFENEKELFLFRWYNHQYAYYLNSCGIFMFDEFVKKTFCEFIKVREHNNKIIFERKWIKMFNKFKLFVDKIGRLPCNVEDEIEYYKWMNTTIVSVRREQGIYNNDKYCKKWNDFMVNIKSIIWITKYKNTIEYIKKHGHSTTKIFSPELYSWRACQMKAFKRGDIFDEKKWIDFLKKYDKYMSGTSKNQWISRSKEILKCIEYKKEFTDDDMIWINSQKKYHKNEEHIMIYPVIRDEWKSNYKKIKMYIEKCEE